MGAIQPLMEVSYLPASHEDAAELRLALTTALDDDRPPETPERTRPMLR
jgi:hypothetical protein